MSEKEKINSKREECLLMCISASPTNGSVINSAGRIAEAFNAERRALFVETTAYSRMSEKDRMTLERNKKLAVRCGASVSSVYGNDVAAQIAEYAKACNATKIVIGRPERRRGFFAQNDIPQQLLQLVPDIEIYIIPCSIAEPYHGDDGNKVILSWRSSLITAAIFMLATMTGLLLKRVGFTDVNIITVYILSVMFISYMTDGYVYGSVSAVLSVLVFNFLFTEPRFSFMAYGTGYPLTFLIMFLAAFLTSSLTARIKNDAEYNAKKAYRTEILLTASRNLQHAENREEVLGETASQILKLMRRPVILYPVMDNCLGKPLIMYPQEYDMSEISDDVCQKERAVAEQVYRNNEQAGATTSDSPEACFWYLAVRGNDSVHAVAGVAVKKGHRVNESERDYLLALLGECGVAMEKQKLRENQMKFAVEAQREKMKADLLRAISHDLRTPLTSISGNAELLMRNMISEDRKNKIYGDIYDDSIWLIDLVENLLSITRIDNEAVGLNLKPELVSDVIDEAVSHSVNRMHGHELKVEINDEFLEAKVETGLIVQVLVNLIDNAVKYTPEGSIIIVSAESSGNEVMVSVADNGPGISDEAKQHVFEMFYTSGEMRSDARRGLGLGLALCRSIIYAHGGNISVSDNMPHGAVFTFNLKRVEETENE